MNIDSLYNKEKTFDISKCIVHSYTYVSPVHEAYLFLSRVSI